MEEIMKIYCNWRCVVLLTLCVCALLLAVCEADSVVLCAATKVAALCCVCVCGALGRRWARAGKIDELLNIGE